MEKLYEVFMDDRPRYAGNSAMAAIGHAVMLCRCNPWAHVMLRDHSTGCDAVFTKIGHEKKDGE